MNEHKGGLKNLYKNLINPILKKDSGIDAEYLTNLSPSEILNFGLISKSIFLKISFIISTPQNIPSSFAIQYALPFSSVIEGLVRSPLPISSSIQLSMILLIIGVFNSTKLRNN